MHIGDLVQIYLDSFPQSVASGRKENQLKLITRAVQAPQRRQRIGRWLLDVELLTQFQFSPTSSRGVSPGANIESFLSSEPGLPDILKNRSSFHLYPCKVSTFYCIIWHSGPSLRLYPPWCGFHSPMPHFRFWPLNISWPVKAKRSELWRSSSIFETVLEIHWVLCTKCAWKSSLWALKYRLSWGWASEYWRRVKWVKIRLFTPFLEKVASRSYGSQIH